jgi:hypothetical protein
MITLNNNMKKRLKKNKIKECLITEDLSSIINDGLIVCKDYVFVKFLVKENYEELEKFISSIPTKLFCNIASYQYFTNKIHLEDYVKKEDFIYSALFLSYELIKNIYVDNIKIILSIDEDDEDERLHSYIFNIYQLRDDEIDLIDIKNIDNYESGDLLVIEINKEDYPIELSEWINEINRKNKGK